jgi:DNA-binding FrmR family transcriptional regulator
MPAICEDSHGVEPPATDDFDHHHAEGEAHGATGIAFGKGVALVESMGMAAGGSYSFKGHRHGLGRIPPYGISSLPMAHVQRDKKKLLTRIRRIGGQVAALERAVVAETDCSDLLVQIAATKGAMHALMMEVLAGHLTEHVVAGETEVERAREAQIIMDLLSKYAR